MRPRYRMAFLLMAVVAAVSLAACGSDNNSVSDILTPAVETDGATSVASTTATLNGRVSPNGLDTFAWFEYGTDNTFATFTVIDNTNIGNAPTSQVTISSALTGLTPATTYYYRAAAENSQGAAVGTTRNFTTTP